MGDNDRKHIPRGGGGLKGLLNATRVCSAYGLARKFSLHEHDRTHVGLFTEKNIARP